MWTSATWKTASKVLIAAVVAVVLVIGGIYWLKFDMERQVEGFVNAFNQHNPAAMAEYVADDVQWLYVTEQGVTQETSSKEALISTMATYFQQCPSCRSELGATVTTKRRLSTVETAIWIDAKGVEQRQQSLSVYEFNDAEEIRKVYYFPSEKVD